MQLVIRADADSEIGTGHVMRSLALAQAWQHAGGQVLWVSTLEVEWLRQRLTDTGLELAGATSPRGSRDDARQTAALAKTRGARCVVVDGYHFGDDFEEELARAGVRILAVDDNCHAQHHHAQVVLNQNLHAEALAYETRARLLLGPRHALLRAEFWPWRDWERVTDARARRVLVTLGGSDPDNVTARVLSALADIKADLSVRVLAGAANLHLPSLRAIVARAPERFDLAGTSNDMPAEMAAADLAISGGGSTCCELAFMGLPALVITLADNQRALGPALAARGVAIDLGRHEALAPSAVAAALASLVADTARRREMSARGRALVDGRGAERVVSTITELDHESDPRL